MYIRTILRDLRGPSNDDSEIADLKKQAVSAFEAGSFDEANNLLNTIRAKEREISERQPPRG